ncbi:uncharacterized protein LOC126885126 [Diabrotica virgifera virgifera]|uniref:Transposase domain-containing protein n=1 Tax=Diabrotica virgifera virgifera TaxID=50390 RepID=A0ABM5KBF1_DIAVI|nr:uncharacterized protein LOC126885126 [Diabrotica virgifera virgifera]
MKRNKAYKYSTTFYRHRKKIGLEIKENAAVPSPNEIEERGQLLTQEDNQQNSHGRTSFDSHHSSNEYSSDSDNKSTTANLMEEEIKREIANRTSLEAIGLKIRQFLPGWATKNQICQNPALNTLLSGLTECGIPNLPKDSRTLLKTPKSVAVQKMGVGHFWYNGLKNCLSNIEKYVENINALKLDFGIDGLPLFNSSSHQFWPILVKIANVPKYPCQIVAIYYGKAKPPSIEEYLEQFCAELKDLIQTGIEADNIRINVEINALICDTPARCYILSVVQFNAYHGCLKCIIRGEYHQIQKRMSYPQTHCQLRTDQDFRMKTDPAHHQKNNDGDCLTTPLESLPIDMIKDIIIADSLHLIDFGVTKKSLQLWVQGSKYVKIKFFNHQINVISDWLVNSNKYMPKEINRSVRPLNFLSYWKATEFHTFLFYLGPVILKDHLSSEIYRHFLLYFVAVFLCSTSIFKDQLDLAHTIFVDYIEEFVSIYGEHSITSNIHNLCHVVEDVKRFGPLQNISSYKFENKLGTIKNLLRSGNKPLHQVVKRLIEIENNVKHSFKDESSIIVKDDVLNKSEKPPGINECFKKVILKNGTQFSSEDKDSWILTKNNKIIKIISVYLDNGNVKIFGNTIKKLCDFFDYPFSSSHIYIYKAKLQFCEQAECIKESDIKCKIVGIEFHNEIVFLPLIHTFDLFIGTH